MADISKITLPSGSTYNIVDEVARQIASGSVVLCGTTSTTLADQATTSPVVIPSARTIRGVEYAAGASYTPVSGDAFFQNSKEFVFDGTRWNEFGDMSGLGALAYKDAGSVTVTPSGSVSVSLSATQEEAEIEFGAGSAWAPSGTVSKPALTKGAVTSTGTFTPSGSVTLTGTAAKTATVSPADSGTATYTPAGTVSAPTISVATAGATAKINEASSKTVVTDISVDDPSPTTAQGELVYCSVSGNTLVLGKFVGTKGASITTTEKTVKTGDAAYTASAPSFTGTGVRLQTGEIAVPNAASFSGTQGSVSVSTTQAVTDVAAPTFTGDGVSPTVTVPSYSVGSASFSGTSQTVGVTFTP